MNARFEQTATSTYAPEGSPIDTTEVEPDFVRTAVMTANPVALRVALYQATGERWLRDLELISLGGPDAVTLGLGFSDADLARLQDRAVEFLMERVATGHGRVEPMMEPVAPDEPSDLISLITGHQPSPTEMAHFRKELAFDEFPWRADWTADRPAGADDFHVTIIGAGWSGIAAAVQMTRLGIPFTLYDRQHEVGGTWSINTYPDVRVDTSSFMYQFKFMKNYPWSEFFARQPEVRQYLDDVADTYGIKANAKFEHEVIRAVFDDASQTWSLEIVDRRTGETTRVSTNAVISGAGLFNKPKKLTIDGVDQFEGDIYYTARWPKDAKLAGRRIAVIGNGSTGVQLLGKVADEAANVSVFQRTPQWISPRENYGRKIDPEIRWLLDMMPHYWHWFSFATFAGRAGAESLQTVDPEWQAKGGKFNEQNDQYRESLIDYMRKELGGREDLLAQVTPDYPPLARRLVVDNGWYRALLRPNVELVTTPIRRLVAEGIETDDGTIHKVDLVISATGFDVVRYLWPTEYIGSGGVTLDQAWEKDGPRAYLGLMVPRFPNFFITYGPNSQIRQGSLASAIEAWVAYAAKAIVATIEGGYRAVDVSPDAFDEYNRALDAAETRLVWESDPGSYYVNQLGRQQVNAPWSVPDYMEMLDRLDPDALEFTR